jgi:hypothetical protein
MPTKFVGNLSPFSLSGVNPDIVILELRQKNFKEEKFERLKELFFNPMDIGLL